MKPRPLWSSGYRPFYLLGAAYAPLLVAGVVGAFAGVVDLSAVGSAPPLWHGHEMVFGFAVAIIFGTLLTALPSWAGTPEVQGARLMLLAALWLLGRAAFWAEPWLPRGVTAAADMLLMPALFAILAPQVWRVANRWYLLLPLILAALTLANGVYHAGILAGDAALARAGLHAGVYALVVLYVLKGGVLTPVFTGNALRARGRGDQAAFLLPLEVLAVAAIVLLAALDLGGAPRLWVGLAALACAVLHAMRIARWRGWRVGSEALLWAMHLSFAWLVIAFALKAVAALTGAVPENAWLHAFTVGALGLMMLGLMTRVVLRHTGRPVHAPRAMQWAYAAMFAAAALRLAVGVHGLGDDAMALAALLWAAPFVVYLALYAAMLVAPSLPRSGPPRQG
ncbi:MAG: NnrS family protein [Rhizobacter sp.]|nr:NnrS family protein [Rhizobacter sp.]